MKYPVAERTVISRLAAGPTNTYAAFSLEPAGYSIPDPAASSPTSDSTAQALHSITTLPGCTARVSLDLDEAPKTPLKAVLSPPSPPPRCGLPPLATSGVSGGVSDRGGGSLKDLRLTAPVIGSTGNTPQRQQHEQQRHQLQGSKSEQLAWPVGQLAQLQELQCAPRDHSTRWSPADARRSSRPSVDAAAGAQMLRTCPASEMIAQSKSSLALDNPQAKETAFAFRGRSLTEPPMLPCASSATPPLKSAQSMPTPVDAAAGTGSQGQYEWTFGENLQHARIAARYAAMDAVDEVVYVPPNGDTDSDSDMDSLGHKARSAWKILASLLGTSKVQKFGKGVGSPVGHGSSGGAACHTEEGDRGRPAHGRGRSRSCAGADRTKAAFRAAGDCSGPDDEPVSSVIRSRDSRRLMRAHRSRVGIDRDGQRPPRALAPALSTKRASGLEPEEDLNDPATAAVIAAAAAFAAVREGETRHA